MKTTLFISIWLAVVCVNSNAEVTEEVHKYYCCDPPLFCFDPLCEHTWSIEKKPFATFRDESRVCVSPCKEISIRHQMIMDTCHNMSLTTVCSNVGLLKETTIIYLSQPCTKSDLKACDAPKNMAAGNQHGPHGFLLSVIFCLLAAIVAW